MSTLRLSSPLRALFQEEFGRARLVAKIVRAAILVVACAIAEARAWLEQN